MARIGFRRTKIYAMIQECAFPEPYKLTPEVTAWIERAMADARTTG